MAFLYRGVNICLSYMVSYEANMNMNSILELRALRLEMHGFRCMRSS